MPVLRDIPVLTTGPAGTLPGLKRRGCGKKLTGHSLEKAQAMGSGAVLFEGSTAFCSHCGFEPARKPGLRFNDLAEDAEDSFFLCGELIPGQLDGVPVCTRLPGAAMRAIWTRGPSTGSSGPGTG